MSERTIFSQAEPDYYVLLAFNELTAIRDVQPVLDTARLFGGQLVSVDDVQETLHPLALYQNQHRPHVLDWFSNTAEDFQLSLTTFAFRVPVKESADVVRAQFESLLKGSEAVALFMLQTGMDVHLDKQQGRLFISKLNKSLPQNGNANQNPAQQWLAFVTGFLGQDLQDPAKLAAAEIVFSEGIDFVLDRPPGTSEKIGLEKLEKILSPDYKPPQP